MNTNSPARRAPARRDNQLDHEAEWRPIAFAWLRIAFGIVWAIDASFKWQPAFAAGFASYLAGAMKGQPHAIDVWIGFWLHLVQFAPHTFAHLTAICESLLALSLITGTLVNTACVSGAFFSFMIWSCPEGFGGPYEAGSTDIGTSIIYIFVFVALLFASAGRRLSVDRSLSPRLGRFGFLAAGCSAPSGQPAGVSANS